MYYYDYPKMKAIIAKYADQLVSASHGIYEDWFYTALPIWEDGKYIEELPDKSIAELKVLEEISYNKKLSIIQKHGFTSLMEYAAKSMSSLMDVLTGGRRDDKLNIITDELSTVPEYTLGLIGSDWGTPTLELVFKNGTWKMIRCYISDGEELPFEDDVLNKIQISAEVATGCFSSEVQDNLPQLIDEEILYEKNLI